MWLVLPAPCLETQGPTTKQFLPLEAVPLFGRVTAALNSILSSERGLLVTLALHEVEKACAHSQTHTESFLSLLLAFLHSLHFYFLLVAGQVSFSLKLEQFHHSV